MLYGPTFRGRRALCHAVLVAGSAVVISACGSSGSSSSQSSGSSGSASSSPSASTGATAGEKEVYAMAAGLSKRPTQIPVTQPVGKPIPSGKHIIWINCGAPVCTVLGKNFAEGAKELGWTTTFLATDGTPAAVQKAWKQAVVSKPDGVASSGTDPAVVNTQIQALKAANIPVVNYSVPKTVDGLTLLTADGPNIGKAFGEPTAAWISKDSQGKANTLYVTIPAFTILPYEQQSFQDTYKKGCPNCKMDVMEIPVTSLGKDVIPRIVSKLRSNPDYSYLAMAVDDLTVGMPAALKSAGLADKIKIIGASSTAANFQYIATDQQSAAVPNDIPGLTWQMVDGFARIFTGQSTAPDLVPAARYIVVKSNVPSTSGYFPFVADYKAQFRKLWGK